MPADLGAVEIHRGRLSPVQVTIGGTTVRGPFLRNPGQVEAKEIDSYRGSRSIDVGEAPPEADLLEVVSQVPSYASLALSCW